MYILTIKANRKDGKRHISTKSNDLDYLKKCAEKKHAKYIVEIYSGNWQLIWRRGVKK